jgi:hypothetical protein
MIASILCLADFLGSDGLCQWCFSGLLMTDNNNDSIGYSVVIQCA